MASNLSIDFFAKQFQRQIAEEEYRLNPFEQRVLPHLAGRVLDLGCGLGNLALEAARAGHDVTAIDACPEAVKDLDRRALAEGLPIHVREADLTEWRATETWDTVVAIGLLMFFTCEQARDVLQQIRRAVAPGGIAAVNVLVEGTTYMAMFDPAAGYCLFPAGELEATFGDWRILLASVDDFPAPGATLKRFATVIAQRPDGQAAAL
jgi:tellurite methyltransferase